MTTDDDVRARLDDAEDLTAVLAAVHGAFEWMLQVLEGHEEAPAGALFASFVMAGAAAADGRDAVAFAPSCPSPISGGPAAGHFPTGSRPGPVPDASGVAATVADICILLQARLAAAELAAADRGDQIACATAARYAAKILRLLTGNGP